MRSDELLANHGFQGSLSVGELQKAVCDGLLPKRIRDAKVPAKPGVYAVVTPSGYVFRLKKGAPRIKKLCLKTTQEYVERWVPDTDIIYIGKGGPGKKATLQTRIQQLIRHGLGKATNHMGGQDIWLLEKDDAFLLYWKECDDARGMEKQLLGEFKKRHGKLPFGNKQN